MLAHFHSLDKTSCSSDKLKRLDRGFERTPAHSQRTLAEIPSGPVALEDFRWHNLALTALALILMLFREELAKLEHNGGILCLSSIVDLEAKLFLKAAFSVADS